jgi:uncharacterized protein YjbJ (UPF0337 family)
VEKIVGRAVGNTGMQARGIVKEVAGTVEKTAGDVANKLPRKK